MKTIASILFPVAVVVLLILCAGCVVAKVEKTSPDGTIIKGELHQTMWQRKGLELDYATNSLHLKVEESGAQSNPIQDTTALLNTINGLKKP